MMPFGLATSHKCMDQADVIHLIRKAIGTGGVWADFGSGEGVFTLALRELAGPEVTIYSIDKDHLRLDRQRRCFDDRFPGTSIQYMCQDFTVSLSLPLLDGIIMANSLHYVEDHVGYLKRTQSFLRPEGKLVVVEYSIDMGNQWVPYPLSYSTFEKEARQADFVQTLLLEKVPSGIWDEMYSAQALCEARRNK